ncbi:MAG TPA: hypothetical protein VLB12_08795 [Gemmatimonadales bacterium]|nr:hypothetical protein [Gemmatimonadales bacterium]
MRQIVYLLGAGFSAPLGLPVMANFLEKAKDQYYDTHDKFEHFGAVLKTISQMHVAKSYYATDAFNIEDILSILDMQGRLVGSHYGESFTRFLTDVISYHTPEPQALVSAPQSWSDVVFWPGSWRAYGPFVAALLGQRFVRSPQFDPSSITATSYSCEPDAEAGVEYSVITLNYDLVLEKAAGYLRTRHKCAGGFTRGSDNEGTRLAKLHGSIDTGDIVPPTWSKSLSPASIGGAWERAYSILKKANDLRIIGFAAGVRCVREVLAQSRGDRYAKCEAHSCIVP